MKKRYKFFVFSDVHGEYDALIESLEEAGYDPSNNEHKLISVGDNFDRGPASDKVYNYLVKNNAICVLGNHDEMFAEYLEKGVEGEYVLFNILHNGLGNTIQSFTKLKDRDFTINSIEAARKNISKDVLEWIQNMPLYFETEHYIFCHAGLDPRLPNPLDTPKQFMLWDIEYSHCGIPSTNKTVVIGHHHTNQIRNNLIKAHPELLPENILSKEKLLFHYKTVGNKDEFRPFFHLNKIGLDGCSNYTKKVNVLVIEDFMLEDENAKEQENITTDQGEFKGGDASEMISRYVTLAYPNITIDTHATGWAD